MSRMMKEQQLVMINAQGQRVAFSGMYLAFSGM
jgi:hypothetical protein